MWYWCIFLLSVKFCSILLGTFIIAEIIYLSVRFIKDKPIGVYKSLIARLLEVFFKEDLDEEDMSFSHWGIIVIIAAFILLLVCLVWPLGISFLIWYAIVFVARHYYRKKKDE